MTRQHEFKHFAGRRIKQRNPCLMIVCGTILVRGTGGSLEPFRNIEDPLRLRSAITAV